MKRFLQHLTVVAGLALAPALAQDITTDPFVLQTVGRANFEPGGKYDLFPGARGVIDPASRAGQIAVVRTSLVRLGSYSLQGATINGSYYYILRFTNHPWWEHSPFSSSSTRSDSVRENRPDGGQTSVSLSWTASQIHPADGYEGAQGGGYPPPTGARDEYTYLLNGTATGVYLISANDLQNLDKPGFLQRLENFGNATVHNLGAGSERTGSGFLDLLTGNGISGHIEGGLDAFLGLRDILFSGASGAITGFLGPEVNQLGGYLGNIAVDQFKARSEEWQYARLANFTSAADWMAENPLYLKGADALLTLTAARQLMAARTASALEQVTTAEGRNLLQAEATGSALKNDLYHYAPTFFRNDAALYGTHTPLLGNDGVTRTLTQMLGELNGVKGRFEYIVDPNGNLTHQLFVPNGGLNGKAIVP